MRGDTRAATSPVSYALTIAIVTILITGLMIAGFGHVSDQRTRTTLEQMDVVAQQVAGSIEAADRLVRADEDPGTLDLTIERDLPRQIQTTDYAVDISGSDVTVRSPITDRDVSVEHGSDVTVDGSTVQGGTIVIEWDGSELEVDNE